MNGRIDEKKSSGSQEEETDSEGQAEDRELVWMDYGNGSRANDWKLKNGKKEKMWSAFTRGLADIPKEVWRRAAVASPRIQNGRLLRISR